MIEDQVRAVFIGIADGEPMPSRVDTGLAYRRGKARLRWRRAGLAGAPVLAAAAIAAVILAVGTAPFRPSPALTGPQAPRQFSPLAPYAAFGWLPTGNPVLQGGSSRSLAFQIAGPSVTQHPWRLDVLAAGYCRLAPSAQELACRVGPQGPSQTWQITAPAPSVLGHRAFWARSAPASQGYLLWQYARGGWAALTKISSGPPTPAWRALALKVAEHVRYGAHAAPPLVFPMQLFGVPAAWRVSALTYVPRGTLLQASTYTLAASPTASFPGGLSQPGLPTITVLPVEAHRSCPAMPNPAHEVVAGYDVVVARVPAASHGRQQPVQLLCAADANGRVVTIKVLGRHPVLDAASLLAHHMLFPGPDPARWARVPIARPVRLGSG